MTNLRQLNKPDTNGASRWKKEVTNILNAIDEPFFNSRGLSKGVMRESACEVYTPFTDVSICNTDQRSFKAYLSRFMGLTSQLCPWTQEFIMTRLKSSASAAAKSCNGGDDKQTCGLSWMRESYDGSAYGIAKGGLGEHISVLEVFQNLLVPTANAPIHNNKTGSSIGDPSAGSTTGLSAKDLQQTVPSTTGDRAGAGILTTLCLGMLLGLTYWLLRE